MSQTDTLLVSPWGWFKYLPRGEPESTLGWVNIYPGVQKSFQLQKTSNDDVVSSECHHPASSSSHITTRHRDRLQSRISSVFHPNLDDKVQKWFPSLFQLTKHHRPTNTTRQTDPKLPKYRCVSGASSHIITASSRFIFQVLTEKPKGRS